MTNRPKLHTISRRRNPSEAVVAAAETARDITGWKRSQETTQIDVASVCVLHRDGEGNPSRIRESDIDLTERKKSEQALAAQVGRLNLLGNITRAIGEREDLSSISRYVIQALEHQLPVDFGCLCLYEHPDSLVVAGIGGKSRDFGMDPKLTAGEHIPVEQNGLAPCLRGLLVYQQQLSELQTPFAQRLADSGLAAMVVAPLLVNNSLFGALLVGRRLARSFSVDECEFLRQLSAHVAIVAHQADLNKALDTARHDLRETQTAVLRQEKLRLLGEMASGIAHDINNALAPAALYVESLLETNLRGVGSREYLLIIQRAIEGVAHTVARMKQVYSSEDPLLRAAGLNLNRTIEQVIDLTHNRWSTLPKASGRTIRLTTDLDPDLPELVADESEIRNALTNLILNAVDAMPSGGELRLRSRALGTDRVQIEVSDTGIGMDEATRNQCLELFFTTKGAQGSGLGLSTVQGAVQRHHGEIQIESAPGIGTTMRVILPIAGSAMVPSRLVPEARTHRRLRILVIDDDQIILRPLRLSLQRDGHTVITAPGGRGGIETFRAACELGQSFDVVITDLGMPQVDGIAVAAAVKALRPDALVILLTGLGHQLQDSDETPMNVDHVLSKPTRLATIRKLLAELAA
jgi:signal transduction histidine kinase/ActR/RegA family two-component response regulator